MVLFVTNRTSCGNGDIDGDGCSRGLAGIDGDGLGAKNGPGGESIPGLSNDWRRCISRGYLLFSAVPTVDALYPGHTEEESPHFDTFVRPLAFIASCYTAEHQHWHSFPHFH